MTEVRKAKDFKDAQNSVGILVSNRQLCSWYDRYAKDVLTSARKVQGSSRNEFTTLVQLPSKDDYQVLKRAKYTQDWDSHLCDIKGWIEDVRDQMENWRDSMPESFHSTDKYSEIEQCYDSLEDALSNLESVSFDDLGDHLGTFAYFPHVGDITKNTTLADAISCLEELISSVENYEVETEEEDEEVEELDSSEIVSFLNEALDSLQGIEIPAVFS